MATDLAPAPPATDAADDLYARPTQRLPWRQLLQISIAVLFGGLILDIVANGFLGAEADFAASPRWAIGIGVLFYVVGAILLVPVKEPERRSPGGALAAIGAPE